MDTIYQLVVVDSMESFLRACANRERTDIVGTYPEAVAILPSFLSTAWNFSFGVLANRDSETGIERIQSRLITTGDNSL